MSKESNLRVNGLPVPPMIISLMNDGRWGHLGDDAIKEVVSFLSEPVDLLSVDQMKFESSGLPIDDPDFSALFHEMRGSDSLSVPDLPWRDVSTSFLIAVNRNLGDDIAIALDFRRGVETDPSVIATDWSNGTCQWRSVSGSLSEFLEAVGFK